MWCCEDVAVIVHVHVRGKVAVHVHLCDAVVCAGAFVVDLLFRLRCKRSALELVLYRCYRALSDQIMLFCLIVCCRVRR